MRIKYLVRIAVGLMLLLVPAYDQLKLTLAEHFGIAAAEGANSDDHYAAGEHPDDQHEQHGEGAGEEHVEHKIVVTSPIAQDVELAQQYVCQIHSCRHIEICAIESGYLRDVNVREGQAVKQGDVMFSILPTLYQAKRDADLAEARLAQVEYDNTDKLVRKNIVSEQELKLAKAKLEKAQAQVNLAQAEVDFAQITSPFDGIIDRLHEQQGSLIDEGAMLTTLSDNSTMWVYFNVPEARYLEYQAQLQDTQHPHNLDIELVLANHQKFPYAGKIGAIEADFNNETGNIAFRGDFPNPDALLRHGQTGTILIKQVTKDAIVIPQRATFEILAKKYAYVVGEDQVVHQREIVIGDEKDDIFVIRDGLDVTDKIILEGIGQVRDGDVVEYEYRSPEEVMTNLKYHAE